MKGLILAAGRGSRMSGLTENTPKCLVQLAGKPLLFWQLEALAEAGIDELAVVCGYRAESIEAVRQTAPAPFQTLLNDRWAKTNMLATLASASEWANGEECIVSYSDIVYPAVHVEALAGAQEPFAVAYDELWIKLWEMRQENPLNDAETFRERNGKLLEIGGKPTSLADIQGQYMGLVKVNPAGWDILLELRKTNSNLLDSLDMTGFFNRLLAEGAAIGAVKVQGKWCEVDTQNDLTIYENACKDPSWLHNWRTLKGYDEN